MWSKRSLINRAFGFFLFSLLLTGCKRDLTSVVFNLNYQTSFTIPSSAGINVPIFIPSPEITTNSTTQFESQGVNASKVTDIRLKKMVLVIIKPSGSNFNFLKSVHLFIQGPSLPETEIAFKDDIPMGVYEIELTPLNKDISGYIKGETFKIKAKVVTRQAILQDVEIDVKMSVQVRASII